MDNNSSVDAIALVVTVVAILVFVMMIAVASIIFYKKSSREEVKLSESPMHDGISIDPTPDLWTDDNSDRKTRVDSQESVGTVVPPLRSSHKLSSEEKSDPIKTRSLNMHGPNVDDSGNVTQFHKSLVANTEGANVREECEKTSELIMVHINIKIAAVVDCSYVLAHSEHPLVIAFQEEAVAGKWITRFQAEKHEMSNACSIKIRNCINFRVVILSHLKVDNVEPEVVCTLNLSTTNVLSLRLSENLNSAEHNIIMRCLSDSCVIFNGAATKFAEYTTPSLNPGDYEIVIDQDCDKSESSENIRLTEEDG